MHLKKHITINYKSIFSLLLFLFVFNSFGKPSSIVTGKVRDADGPLIGANILIKGKVIGTVTDVKGDFSLQTTTPPPFTLKISMVGYKTQAIELEASTTLDLEIQLDDNDMLATEIVISGSRVEESILESPINIQKVNILGIQNTPSHDFYASLRELNGVDIIAQSLTFQSVNVRGFGSAGNVRFVQLIDGIDNQAPGLNFPLGNAIGIGDLDLESVEVLTGSASALYGPNAIQGIILMNSKSPFEYQGLDAYTKLGINHVDGKDHAPSLYQDNGIRYAKAFNKKIAFKVNASYMEAQDFIGVDLRDQSFMERGGSVEGSLGSNRTNNRFYDGINVYGDPTINIAQVVPELSGVFRNSTEAEFTPTGFTEKELVDNTVHSLKLGTALHYRINENIEFLGQFNYGNGTTIYIPAERFILENFSIWTAKAEVRGDNFFVRAYQTKENSGDTYSLNAQASLMNLEYYVPDYIESFANSIGSGLSVNESHRIARQFADSARTYGIGERAPYAPGTPEFDRLSEEYKSRSVSDSGAHLVDKSALFHYEASYNFKQIKWAEIVAGANYRTYALNSGGTLFALRNEKEVSIDEYGGYVQIKKRFWDKLSIYGSIRYDKNENFKGQFSPRVSSVWELKPNKFLRGSFQRGFRIPTTQDQFIELDLITRRALGRNSLVTSKYNFNSNRAYTTQSIAVAQASGNIEDLEIASDVYTDYETEQIGTWEFGHKGLYFDESLFLDFYAYQSTYSNILAELEISQAVGSDAFTVPEKEGEYNFGGGEEHSDIEKEIIVSGGRPGEVNIQNYLFQVNASEDVVTRGFGLSGEYSFLKGYLIGFNTSYNKMVSLDDLIARRYGISFNNPEWRFSFRLANRKLTEKIGFNISYNWQDAYLWESSIGSGVVPAFGTWDAQITHEIPAIRARVKFGGSNILNRRYTAAFANPRMGALYYVQLSFNNILNRY